VCGNITSFIPSLFAVKQLATSIEEALQAVSCTVILKLFRIIQLDFGSVITSVIVVSASGKAMVFGKILLLIIELGCHSYLIPKISVALK
jgi:hypothetical protein